jgi:hypothetical protein
MKKWAFLIVLVCVLVSFQAKTAHAGPPIGVAQCSIVDTNHPDEMCTELTGIVSGPPTYIQNIGPIPCSGPHSSLCGNQCKIGWSSGYTITQDAMVNNSCHDTYNDEVLGSWQAWGTNLPTNSYIAPVMPNVP